MLIVAALVLLATVADASRIKTKEVKGERVVANVDGDPETFGTTVQAKSIYKCETIPTYNAKDTSKTCMGHAVSFACFSLDHASEWQCFDDEASALKVECPTAMAGNGKNYAGACVYARDFTFWGKLDGSNLKTTGGPGDSGASGQSMATAVLMMMALSAMWQ